MTTDRKEFFQIAAAVIGAEVVKDGAAPEGVLHKAADYYRAALVEWDRLSGKSEQKRK